MIPRQLAQGYDRYQVDTVWDGLIRSCDRTWPLKANKAFNTDGTISMETGGAKGGLDSAGSARLFFQSNVRHGHHDVMVCVNGGNLEFKAFDLDGRLFGTIVISKADRGD